MNIYAIKFRWETHISHVAVVAAETEEVALQNFDVKMKESPKTEDYTILRLYEISGDDLLKGEILVIP